MRNFKRVLSLALALVMVIGMMVMGAGAAPLADADEIEYIEAVEVARALKIIDGLPNGSFNPKGELTREGAAILVCRLVMGRENADKLVGVNGFADVAPGWYSAGYIEWCVNNGYVGGFPDGKFYPTLPMVTYGFGKLLLCALGYDAVTEGYGSAASIQEDMIEAGIAVQGVNMDATLTREVAAQMLLNTLSATMVEYQGGMSITTPDGTQINAGATRQEKPQGAVYADNTGIAGLQFCERYYPTLVKDNTAGFDTDEFGRPGYTWKVDNDRKNDVFIAEKPFAVYAQNMDTVAGKKAMTETFKGITLGLTKDNNYVDGKAEGASGASAVVTDVVADSAAINKLTSDTAVVEVYVNKATKKVTDIVKINTYADTVATFVPYNAQPEAKAYITLTNGSAAKLTKIETDKFAAKDVVLYTKVYNATATAAAGDDRYDINTMEKAQAFTGVLTSWTKDSKYTIGGDVFAVSGAPVSGFTTSTVEAEYGETMVWYVGSDGKLIYVTEPSGAAPVVIKDYLVVLDSNLKMTADAWAGTKTATAQVKVVLADGTPATYDLPLVKLAADDATNSLDKGDYVLYVGTTPVEIIDKAVTELTNTEKNALKAALGCATANQPTKVFTYTVSGTALTLASELGNFTGTETASGVKLGGNSAAAVTKASIAITDNTDKTIIANSNTVFVLKTATGFVVKTGVTALENTSIAQDKALIVTDVTKGTSANTNVATVVFAVETTFTGSSATNTNDLIYVDSNYIYTQKADGTPVYTYTGIKADGTVISVTGGNSVAEGIYKVKTDKSIGDSVASTEYTVGLIAGTTADVNGYKTVTDATKVVVVAEGASFVTGAKVFYADTNSDGVIDLIYVTEKAAN